MSGAIFVDMPVATNTEERLICPRCGGILAARFGGGVAVGSQGVSIAVGCLSCNVPLQLWLDTPPRMLLTQICVPPEPKP